MIPALALALALTPRASAQACQVVQEVPESLQVAWVSRASKRVRGGSVMEVVRVADLRAWIRDNGADKGRLLQGLGMAPRDATKKAAKDWKITIFDVRSEWMCRPIDGAPAAEDRSGAVTCDEKAAKPLWSHKKGYSGCGYTLDTGSSTRGLDVYRVTWGAAAAYGFCVMPLDRFLGGA